MLPKIYHADALLKATACVPGPADWVICKQSAEPEHRCQQCRCALRFRTPTVLSNVSVSTWTSRPLAARH